MRHHRGVDNSPTLAGRRVLLPQRTDRRLADALRAAGVEVDEVELISRTPVPSDELAGVADQLSGGLFDWLVLTSSYTLEALTRLGHPLYRLLCPDLQIAAVGDATAAAVRASGGWVDLTPIDGAGGTALASNWPPGTGRVLIPGAVESAQQLPQALRERGWEVVELGVYRTSPVASLPPQIVENWRAGCYDALVVTAGSVASSAAALLGASLPVVAVGERSAREAERLGFPRVIGARTPSGQDVVSALAVVCSG